MQYNILNEFQDLIRINFMINYCFWYDVKHFDVLNAGRVTVSQFRRGLDALQVSSLGHLYLAEPEIDALIALYKDPNDPDRVCWRTFKDDIDHGTQIIKKTCWLLMHICVS